MTNRNQQGQGGQQDNPARPSDRPGQDDDWNRQQGGERPDDDRDQGGRRTGKPGQDDDRDNNDSRQGNRDDLQDDRPGQGR